MKAVVNQDLCIGCGLCCGMCDAVFRMNADGKSEAYQEATKANQSDVQSAMDSCPVTAIHWED